jgi:DNA-binding transcriptional regulator YiaG
MSFLLSGKAKVAEGLRSFRSRFGLNQTEFSVLCAVSLRTLQNLENQSVTPTGRTLAKIDSASSSSPRNTITTNTPSTAADLLS